MNFSPAFLNPIVVEDKTKIKGAQVCVWEMTYEQEVERVKEGLSAFSEHVWTINRVVDTDTFVQNYESNTKFTIDKLIDGRIV